MSETVKDAPLTDEELVSGMAAILSEADALDNSVPARLVAEVRRLRSDEWIRRAAAEFYGPDYLPAAVSELERIIRKHRDGA